LQYEPAPDGNRLGSLGSYSSALGRAVGTVLA